MEKTYLERIEKTKILEQTPLKDYLEMSLKRTKKDDLCKGWDFLKNNLTSKLYKILKSERYNNIIYNSQNVDFILNEIDIILNDELKKQLSGFVYVWKDIKRECKKKEQEQNLKKEMDKRGFIEQGILNEDDLKRLDSLRVFCVLDISKIGLLGSYDKKEELKGTLKYSDYHKSLMLIPKRSRTRGFIIRNKFYYKIIK